MAATYKRKKHKYTNVLYTVATAIVIFAVFLFTLNFFYVEAEKDAHDALCMQTEQIKNDLHLQLESDRETLITMANLAAELYADGEGYNVILESFKPIGLFSDVGILNQDNTFLSKTGTTDVTGKLSFLEEKDKGEYIREIPSAFTGDGKEIIVGAVPIKVHGNTVGILYGEIQPNVIRGIYKLLAKRLDAQLFVYDKDSGDFIVDTINSGLDEVLCLKNIEYNDGYSYEQQLSSEEGFTSFKSAITGEDMYAHYSAIEDGDWCVMFACNKALVFAKTNKLYKISIFLLIIMAIITAVLIVLIWKNERNTAKIDSESAYIKRLLLEIRQQSDSLYTTLEEIQAFSDAHAVFFADTERDDRSFFPHTFEGRRLSDEEWRYFAGELLRYAYIYRKADIIAVNVMHIVGNKKLEEENPVLRMFMAERGIKACVFALVVDKNNHVNILGVVNPPKRKLVHELLQEIAVYFSVAIYNEKYLNKTELAATTDALTGALNRAQYKKDILAVNAEMPQDFSCIYIDVNELHIRNNKYGHAAGDEMLTYIVNTLKDVFFGHNIYRIGGDEFLVFIKDTKLETVNEDIGIFSEMLKKTEYNVSIGVSHRRQNTDCEAMVREAEVRMYEAKAEYYQNKENMVTASEEDKGYVHTKTGINEIDTMLSVLKEHYNGIYKVSLDTDRVHRILMPAYLGYEEDEEHFSKLLLKYINETVHPDFSRAVLSFLNYDAVKRQIAEGNEPRITYKKTNGETITLSVHNAGYNGDEINETLWVFARD